MVTTGSPKLMRIIGGSLQYSSVGFMPVIVFASDWMSTAVSDGYVLYDTSVTSASTIFYTVDSLAVNRATSTQN